ncbi:MAG: beta-glucuronidase [Eubacteriales bacterium]|nr:beta-glucuronidase [Eubacteriales bacterium]
MKNGSMLYPRETATRRLKSLDGMWDLRFDPSSTGSSEGWANGLDTSITIPVPASFQDFFTDKDAREYCGDLWYARDLYIPKEYEGLKLALRFGAATHRAIVYVNGQEVFRHEGGFLPFSCDITEVAQCGAENKVVVKLNNELSETNLPCGTVKVLKNGKKIAKPYFDFYNYSGLNRSVYLTAIPADSVFGYETTYAIDGTTAQVGYTVKTASSAKVEVSLFDEDGVLAARAEGATGTLTVEDAKLWQVGKGYLYKIVIRLLDGDTLLDEYYDFIGIRTVEVKGTDILINGAPVYLKGFGKHEDSDIVGRGTNIAQTKRDFELMKWIGANSFRTSHYPYSEEVYQMADREGFLVIDEVPAVGMLRSIANFLDASTGAQTNFFSGDHVPKLLERHLDDIADMIERDKNHPCVFAWSLLNEPETTDESAVPYFERVFEQAAKLDPQKRPRTFALVMNSVPDKCKCYQFSDIIALNRYFGWYVNGGPEICDAKEAFIAEMDKWQALDLDKPFIFTEYGADTHPGIHKLPSVMWSQEYQIEYLKMCHEVFDSYPFVKGEQVWNFADFQTTEGIMRCDGNKKGIFTRQRQPKDAAFYFKKRWDSLPLDHKSNK